MSMRLYCTAPKAATLLALGVLLACAAPVARAQVDARKVAIANPAHVFNQIQETKDLQAKFNADLNSLNEERKKRELQIRDTRAQRDALKPESEDWAARNSELTRLLVDFRVWQELVQADLERQQKQQMRMIFDRITETIGQVAQQRGIELVIAEVRPELPPNLDEINANDLRARLVSRNVLFSTPGVDISDDVIAAMDAKYKGGGR